MGAIFSAPVQTGPGAHPASYTMGTGSLPGVKWPGCGVDHQPHLAPRLKSGAVTLFLLWSFVDCSRVNFTFFVVYTACAYVGFFLLLYKPHVVHSTGQSAPNAYQLYTVRRLRILP